MHDEAIDLADYPDALAAYRLAFELGRRIAFRAGADSSAVVGARDEAKRELARLRSRLKLRGKDPATRARELVAIGWGEADGVSGC